MKGTEIILLLFGTGLVVAALSIAGRTPDVLAGRTPNVLSVST